MLKYVLLARHGSIDRDPAKPDNAQQLKKGVPDVTEAASALAELLNVQPKSNCINIGELWHGSYRPVLQTAGVYYHILEKNGIRIDPNGISQCDDLDPERYWKKDTLAGRQAVGERLLRRLKELSEDGDPKTPQGYDNGHTEKPEAIETTDSKYSQWNAILVVGHQPHLGWIAETILRRPVPISRAELVCIAIDDSPSRQLLNRVTLRDFARGRRWVAWVISQSDDQLTVELRGKIESKMKLAGLWGALSTAMLGLLFGALLQKDKLSALDPVAHLEVQVSAGLFLVGLGLYLPLCMPTIDS